MVQPIRSCELNTWVKIPLTLPPPVEGEGPENPLEAGERVVRKPARSNHCLKLAPMGLRLWTRSMGLSSKDLDT